MSEVNDTKDSQEAAGGPARTVPGTVISARADKTVTVLVERRVLHPLYK
ncbi:MAG: 30S ribosomal protein S17, partial [Gammaproteobacteria bacterium]|nr:30S ribosomal protein S17 [Gammaproteobacteria bacterium]NIW87026.1 30S ribosomal protein S17 [Gammaproteobacteria bacterium]